ncbi:MAG: helix-turn-helix transcriptional regulator [Paracoccaceae bacterium]|jgi:transcriptional regulator with XRE-family HTH domain
MAHPVDQHVGKRIRHRRWLVGMTQQQLADQVGIKFQQIQKYETGANRVSASRLWDIAKSLQVDISFFFEGIEGDEAQVEAGVAPSDVLSDKEALELLRSYYAIPENQRRRLFDLARVLSDVS